MGNSGPPLGIRGNGDWGLGDEGDEGDEGEKFQLRITNYELRITNYELRITNYEFPMPHAPCPLH
ncbi:alpha/beta hydrolase [Tolypothrix sp. PCC 7601]|uniref:alpha/beta hydrolase n=1 Tax=Tolypothrix sp. PCC 7601 TaxID=1188 RepID=UPI0012D77C01|nr:alpha/beta hydrolase [Tolypothrix sp. PCC 7601]UYD24327.1 alpha/beta hydrolase [Tolypothrix sp. PCC 7712]